jgi:hypothetical protein
MLMLYYTRQSGFISKMPAAVIGHLSSVLRDDSRLGGKENSETSDACAEVQGVRLEAMEEGVAPRRARAIQ